MQEREQKWYSGMLGVTFNANEGRITIFRSMLRHLDGQRITDFCTTGRWGRLQSRHVRQRMQGASSDKTE